MIRNKRCKHIEWNLELPYCPICKRDQNGELDPNLYTNSELKSREKSAAFIRRSFETVRLGGGMTIHEADLEGWDEDGEGELARSKDPEVYWWEIPDWKLEKIHVLSYAFDVDGWRFHLPAYLTWTLMNWRITDSVTADNVVWALELKNKSRYQLERFETLDSLQSKSVFTFLQHFQRFSTEYDADKIISSYWGKFGSI